MDSDVAPPNVNLKEGEELALSLSEALSSGNSQEAAELCQKLCQLSLPVTVSVNKEAYPQDTLRLKVGVEDALSDVIVPLTIEVPADMKIAQLKEKIKQDFGFPPTLQRWVIGKRLARDTESLYSHGIRANGDQAYLFILSAQGAQVTRQQLHFDQNQERIDGIVETMELMKIMSRGAGGDKRTPPPSISGPDQTPPTSPQAKPITKPTVAPKPQLGWTCSMCTLINKPTRPGCEACGAERPEGYQVPAVYQPDQQEVLWLQQEQTARMQYEQAQQDEREKNYLHLLATEEQSAIPNADEVECPICFSTVEPGEGVVLRECLHSFCRECLQGTIINSQDAMVSCPDNCDSKILDREIKAEHKKENGVLLSEEQHQRFLELRLSIAESNAEHSFHCQTPNCRGWCVYEDEVNEFLCDICEETNCILCRAIHPDMNCKDYQDDLQARAANDEAAQKTKQMLESLLQNGEAMKCPRCDVIVQKKGGCDWICCVMCKTEICWVTKQARWGPNGTGDTSGGCKCRVNNKSCHPNCKNCH